MLAEFEFDGRREIMEGNNMKGEERSTHSVAATNTTGVGTRSRRTQRRAACKSGIPMLGSGKVNLKEALILMQQEQASTSLLQQSLDCRMMLTGRYRKELWFGKVGECVTRYVQAMSVVLESSSCAFSLADITIEPLRRWYDVLSLQQAALSIRDLAHLALAMQININVRDALLMSILDETHQWYQIDELVALGLNKHDQEITVRLQRCLNAQFTNPDPTLSIMRARRIRAILKTMLAIVENMPALTISVNALLSYVSWWYRLGLVNQYADAAISVDKHCSLAHIVKSAYRYHLNPAWWTHYADYKVR